jgi:hypothetical protein
VVGGFAPVVFVPGTLVRTWGTRPVSWNFVGVSSYVDREPVLVVTKKSESRTSGAKSLSDRTLYGTAGAVPLGAFRLNSQPASPLHLHGRTAPTVRKPS